MWIIKVYNIRDEIASVLLYLFQNIEEKCYREQNNHVWRSKPVFDEGMAYEVFFLDIVS